MELKPDSTNLEAILYGLSRRYIVPDYQRDYAWTVEQVDELMRDIVGAFRNKSEYFMGALVLNQEGMDSDDDYAIIDGQQRLATFTVFFSVIRDIARSFREGTLSGLPGTQRQGDSTELLAKAEKLHSIAEGRLLHSSEPDNYFITLNKKDQKLFSEKIQVYSVPDLTEQALKIAKSDHRLIKAKKTITRCLKELFLKKQEGLGDLYECLIHTIKKLVFLRIIVKSDHDAYLLFESNRSVLTPFGG